MKHDKKNIKTTLEEFLNENRNDELNISYIFRKYKQEFGDDYNDDNFIENKDEIFKGLRESLELIGDGEISERSYYDIEGDRLMYEEKIKDDTLLLIVHAAFDKKPHGSFKSYRYEIALYYNNESIEQIGGGYGTSGIMTKKYTNILGSSDNYCRNKKVISATCEEIKKYALNNDF